MSKDIELTVRDLVLLDYCLQEKTLNEMALAFGVHRNTIGNALREIPPKFGVNTLTEAVAAAVKLDLLKIKNLDTEGSGVIDVKLDKSTGDVSGIYEHLTRQDKDQP